jgi:predicted ATPase
MDVAGYSRLMGADEEGTHERLKAHLRQLVNPKIRQHRGRIVKNTGDGMLAEFSSVVDAVRCAITIQRGMAVRNAQTPEDRRIDFRAGINIGDVIVEPDDIYGDGVNIAARLEAMAEPGGICISHTVLTQTRGKLDFPVADLGAQALKNITQPVHVFRVVAAEKRIPKASLPLPDKPSIAMLPFQKTSGDPEQESTALTNLPEPVSELIGRDAELDDILDISASHRLVTLTGAGGIGKTRLGFEVARHLLPRFADGVWAIELAPLSDPELVPVTVATALGLELASGTASPQSVANALRSKQLMLVRDNCEHVVDAAARMAEALLRANPAARVIATGRESLRVDGEWVYPVPPLAVPVEGSPDGEDPLRYGAVQLFVERARAAAPSFSPDARVAAAIAGICRRLDGIPLAIEFAAARVGAFGIKGLASRLDDRFQLLAGGHRTAMPRHQTLRATLDWSYELLTEPERMVQRRLAIFPGGFTLEAASAVAADDGIAPSEVIDCVANLVTKSLVTADTGGAEVRYRLLETTRAYALEKLVQAGEFDAAARRHAERYRDLFESGEANRRMAGGLRPGDRQRPRGARLGVFAER